MLLFSGICLLLICALSWYFLPKDNGEEDGVHNARIYGFLGEPKDSIDVLILGDSLAECTISPLDIWNEYGITSYNLGTPCQQLNDTEEYVHKFFQYHSPKIVLFEVHMLFTDYDQSEVVTQKVEQVFPVFRYHDLWKTVEASRMLRRVRYTNVNPTKGFRPSEEVDEADRKIMRHHKENKYISEISQENLDCFDRILTFCQDNGAQLLLFSAPTLDSWNLWRHNGMVRFVIENGLPYVDLNMLQDEIEMDWEKDTFDAGDHLNSFGAEKVTSWVGKYLMDTGLFEDKRQNPAFSDWNVGYTYYKEHMEDFVYYYGEW